MDPAFKLAKDADFASVNEVIQWRIRAATAWSVLLLLGVYPIFNFGVTANMWNPGVWVYDFTLANFSWSMPICLSWCCVLLVCANHCFVQLRTVRPLAVRTRLHSLALLSQVPPIYRLAAPFATAVACGLLSPAVLVGAGAASAVQPFVSWTAPCKGREHDSGGSASHWTDTRWCVNEYRSLVFIYGMLVGAAYAVRLQLNQDNCMVFPILQQPKFFRCKALLRESIWSAVRLSWIVLRYTYLVFLVCGVLINGWRASAVLPSDSSSVADGPLTSVWRLLSLELAWQLFVTGILVAYCLEASRIILHVYLTEGVAFPIESDFDEDQGLTLPQALMAERCPYVQYLAFMDLAYLAKHDRARRHEIFSLSQPGGHPRRWRRICHAALSPVTSLTVRIRQHLSPAATASAGLSGAPRLGASVSNGSAAEPHQQAAAGLASLALAGVKQKLSQVLRSLGSQRFVSYFVTDLTDSACGHLFADSQKILWAVEGLSNLVIASYTEDEYGAVQGSLKDVITALLNMQEALDKFVRASPGLLRRQPAEPGFNVRSVELLLNLRACVRSSIHRLSELFGHHGSFLSLSAEHQTKLKMIAEYKE